MSDNGCNFSFYSLRLVGCRPIVFQKSNGHFFLAESVRFHTQMFIPCLLKNPPSNNHHDFGTCKVFKQLTQKYNEQQLVHRGHSLGILRNRIYHCTRVLPSTGTPTLLFRIHRRYAGECGRRHILQH